jgi:hypothetical protein
LPVCPPSWSYRNCTVSDLTGDGIDDAVDLDGDTIQDFIDPSGHGYGLTMWLDGTLTILVSPELTAVPQDQPASANPIAGAPSRFLPH